MRSFAFAAAALALASPLLAQATKTEAPPLPPLVWDAGVRRQVASMVIVRGVLRVDREVIAAARRKGDHVPVSVEVHEMVHGPDVRTLQFAKYVPPATRPRPDDHPTPDELLALDGQDRILFLTTVNGTHYPIADDGSAIVAPARDVLARLKQREVLHRRLLREPLPLDRQRQASVAALLEQVVRDPEQQREAFAGLEQLGSPAVAEIVAAMDDRRLLPARELTLVNHAKEAFERTRRYQPKRVVDGVAAILNQLTGESFGSLYSGARDEERDACVRAWTIYAHYLADAARREQAGKARR